MASPAQFIIIIQAKRYKIISIGLSSINRKIFICRWKWFLIIKTQKRNTNINMRKWIESTSYDYILFFVSNVFFSKWCFTFTWMLTSLNCRKQRHSFRSLIITVILINGEKKNWIETNNIILFRCLLDILLPGQTIKSRLWAFVSALELCVMLNNANANGTRLKQSLSNRMNFFSFYEIFFFPFAFLYFTFFFVHSFHLLDKAIEFSHYLLFHSRFTKSVYV